MTRKLLNIESGNLQTFSSSAVCCRGTSVPTDGLRDFQIKKYPIVLKAGGQGAGSRGRESRSEV